MTTPTSHGSLPTQSTETRSVATGLALVSGSQGDCNKDGIGEPFVKAGEFREAYPVVREWTTAPTKRAQSGDVLVCVVGATAGKINLGIDCVIGRSVAAVRPLPTRLDTHYLYHFLGTKTLVLRASSQGMAQGVITREMLLETEIPLPPLEQQRRIASILDKAQRLEQQAEEQITKLDYLACSIFDQVISKSRDSDAVMDIALGDLSLLSGQYGAGCSSAPYDTALPRYVRITDIQEDGFLSSAKVSPSGSPADWEGLELEPGDLLFARSGATVGKTYMHSEREGPCIFAGYLIRFRVDQRLAMPDYVYAFTRTKGYRKWVDRSQRAVAQPNINAKQYSELRIPLPSLEVQKSYCEKAKAILSQSDSCRQRLNMLRSLKLSLASNLIKA